MPPHHAAQYPPIQQQPPGFSSPFIHPTLCFSQTPTHLQIDPACHLRYLDTSSHPAYTRHASHEQHRSTGRARTNHIWSTLHSRDHDRSSRPYPGFGRGSSWRGSVPAGQSRKTSTIGYRVRDRVVDRSKSSFRHQLCQEWSKVSRHVRLFRVKEDQI
jgi:hypothetical protein